MQMTIPFEKTLLKKHEVPHQKRIEIKLHV